MVLKDIEERQGGPMGSGVHVLQIPVEIADAIYGGLRMLFRQEAPDHRRKRQRDAEHIAQLEPACRQNAGETAIDSFEILALTRYQQVDVTVEALLDEPIQSVARELREGRARSIDSRTDDVDDLRMMIFEEVEELDVHSVASLPSRQNRAGRHRR